MRRAVSEEVLAIDRGSRVRNDRWPGDRRHMDEAEIAMLTDVIRSGRLGKRTGTKVRQLEEAFARRYGVRHAVA